MDRNDLLGVYKGLRQETRDQWDRTLPMNDMLADRWEQAEFLGFGEGASIYQQTYVYGDVRVGEGSWVGPNVLLDGSGGPLRIGSHCSVSTGVQVYTHDSIAWALTGGRAQYRRAPVTIGDNCYIGPMSVITKGVTIGDGTLVGALTVVVEDAPAGSIVRGNPGRIVGRVHVEGDDLRLEFFDEGEQVGCAE